MNILIDIGHPGHVHLFKYTATALAANGHNIYYSVRDIPVAKRLMDAYGMPYIDLGKKRDSIYGKAMTVVKQDLTLLRFVRKHHIDIGLSSGMVLSHVAKLTKMKSIVFDDDDDSVEKLVVKYAHPFADAVMTPSAIRRSTKKAIYYNGTHELAYLHPKRFKSDHFVLDKAGIKPDEKFFIMRFVALKGHHDIGQVGLSLNQKLKLANLLQRYGRVIITSEREVEPEFERYRLPVAPEDIHSLMSYSSAFVGDSQTMTSEAALLGIPSFKCNSFAGRLSVPNLYEEYGLCKSFTPDHFADMYRDIELYLKNPDLKNEWENKRERFLNDMIDPTAFFTWFIESYPDSVRIMHDHPDYQWRFR